VEGPSLPGPQGLGRSELWSCFCCAEASHFSGKMSRLVLICGPIVSVACGNLVLQFSTLGWPVDQLEGGM